jgi:uncharacterized membrane protein YkvA (DUF1232 family)
VQVVQVLAGVAAGVILLWLALVGLLWRAERRLSRRVKLREALRLMPDLMRVLKRLAADGTLPRGVRIRLALLLGYLLMPIDLVPDFVPVLGYADDIVVTALVLRSVLRAAGPEALARHWPGTDDGLALVLHLTGHEPERT